MQLVERDGFFEGLQNAFQSAVDGEGHIVFVSGEAGIGKSSLVKAFCNNLSGKAAIYTGTCDALFTPRPLAPLYDILLQLKFAFPKHMEDIADRTSFFSNVFHVLDEHAKVSVVVFEDLHWADEATLDFIKFLARRISQLQCLLILTYRDDEVHSRHPLKNLLGQLNPGTYTRLQLAPLSKEVVEEMATSKGFNGKDVYDISGGNPFYVNEIIASYSPGIPDNIKDSILFVYNRQSAATRAAWELLSIFPGGLHLEEIFQIGGISAEAISESLDKKILVQRKNLVFFKHELYRRTVESSLSPLLYLELNKKILSRLLDGFELQQELERIIHHAKAAGDKNLIVKYSPMAARQAAAVGAHIEASKLYLSALENYHGDDSNLIIQFYEGYAHECYLTNQVQEAILATTRALQLWQQKNNPDKIGNSFRFLSRLWWFAGNREQAESFGWKAIEVLEDRPASSEQARAFSNMSQLKMLASEREACIKWGNKAITIATELNDNEILSHALNNIGNVKMNTVEGIEVGLKELQQSLELALKYGYHEHAARSYTNLSSKAVSMKNYSTAAKIFDEGINYCEERGLDAWTLYMNSWKARLLLETGHWDEANLLATSFLHNQLPVNKITALVILGTIQIRKVEGQLPQELIEAKELSLVAMELQRIVPVFSALFEFEWINQTTCVDDNEIQQVLKMLEHCDNLFDYHEFAYWLLKARGQEMPPRMPHKLYHLDTPGKIAVASDGWREAGSPYMQALTLFLSTDDDKRKALGIIQELGATAVYEKLKREMRMLGIKNIPRGIRKTTRDNVALLTQRELDILSLLNAGLKNKEIATKLFIAAKTVDHHLSSIFFKLEVDTRIKAVQRGKQLGILK